MGTVSFRSFWCKFWSSERALRTNRAGLTAEGLCCLYSANLSCALPFQPIPSVDRQSHHIFSFVLRRSFFYLSKTVSVTPFPFHLCLKVIYTHGSALLPSLLAGLITVTRCTWPPASSEVTCSSQHHYLLPFWHSHSAFLTFALVPKLLPLARCCLEIMSFIICSASVFLQVSFPFKACESILYPRLHPCSLVPLTAWRLTSSLDWTVTDQHTHYACVRFSSRVYVFSFPYCGRAFVSILPVAEGGVQIQSQGTRP